jgi:predicted amino acid racemase
VRLIARVVGPHDVFHPGQEGGIPLDELGGFAERVAGMQSVELAGVTSYPCLDILDGRAEATPNIETLRQAVGLLPAGAVMNAPGHTSVLTLPLLRALGAAQAEPGHALTGSTPLHASGFAPEEPAVVYATEVSHRLDSQRVAVIGGGMYSRSRAVAALVATSSGELLAPIDAHPPDAIDYYLSLQDGGRAKPGDVAVMAYRFQAFVTRAPMAAVAGLPRGPRVVSISDPRGVRLELSRM